MTTVSGRSAHDALTLATQRQTATTVAFVLRPGGT